MRSLTDTSFHPAGPGRKRSHRGASHRFSRCPLLQGGWDRDVRPNSRSAGNPVSEGQALYAADGGSEKRFRAMQMRGQRR